MKNNSSVTEGEVNFSVQNRIAEITFSHPKGNSLTGRMLDEMTNLINGFSGEKNISAVLIRSGGENVFCGGASLGEFKKVKDIQQAKSFFLKFAGLLLAISGSKKLTVVRVQGKTVGGGVGIIAVCDYALALDTSAIRLSELDLGIGPFVIGPVVERKIGRAKFGEISIDSEWRDARWCFNSGLFSSIFSSVEDLDRNVIHILDKIKNRSSEATEIFKGILRETDTDLAELLEQRAEMSARLVLSPAFRQNFQSDHH